MRFRTSLSRLAIAAVAFLALSAAASAQDDDINGRLDRLENSLHELTGTIEQLQYRNQQLEQRINQLQGGGSSAAVSQPPAVAQGGPAPIIATSPQAPQQLPPPVAANGRRSDAFDPNANPTAPGAPRSLGGGQPLPPDGGVGAPGGREAGAPLNLGTMNPPGAGPAVASADVATPDGPRGQFDLGIGYMQRKDYASAEQTLRDYMKKYPSDAMVAEAQFWIGESLYQRQSYRDAAEAFLAVSRNYNTSTKAPDALLRLGQSLAALNEKDAACAALGEVSRKYPKAAAGVKKSVDAEQKKNHC